MDGEFFVFVFLGEGLHEGIDVVIEIMDINISTGNFERSQRTSVITDDSLGYYGLQFFCNIVTQK
ncbi:hypothetical protein Lser_V15G25134 [Lactuca serriola]